MKVLAYLFLFHCCFAFTESRATGLTFYTEHFPPYSYVENGSEELKGISVEIVNEILKRTKFSHSVRLLPWNRAYELTLTHKNACLFSTGRTADREPLFKWISPFTEVSMVLFSQKVNPIKIKSLEELEHYRIGGYLGDAAANYLMDHNISIENVTNNFFNIKKLEKGRIDLWATGELAGLQIAQKAGYANLHKAYTLMTLPGGIACNRQTDDILIARMQDELKTLYEEGFIAQVYQRYMPELTVPSY
ncbi:substrate-binding periplasmic protein [Terasakiella pusilla]|uniref:substrate-binding periplasmic protein n=1 Tax=Terasakiella pusilla TaxID=64973 RepID=UPI003AA92B79